MKYLCMLLGPLPMKLIRLFACSLLCFSGYFSVCKAQTLNPVPVTPAAVATPAVLGKPTLSNQLREMIERAATQEDFRVIRQSSLMQFQANLLDSLSQLHQSQARTKAQIADLDKRLKKTEELLIKSESAYQELSSKRDSMELFGMPVNKASYQTIVLVLIVLLMMSTGFFYYRFSSRNGVTSRVEKLLHDTQDEFDQYKKRAIEREQKLKRELQDELNKKSS